MLKRLAALGLALSLLPSLAGAKVYYVNQGVKYHIGDDRFNKSIDSEFMDAYPVVGQEWIQAFRVNQADTIKVHIDHIWGVDDCPYCKVMVAIDDHDMGRLTAENNHEPFDTLQPLAYHVVPGRTYLVKVTSYGTDQVDDFAIEGVRVETEVAEVEFLKPGPILRMPGEALPRFSEPQAVASPCDGGHEAANWLPAVYKSRGYLEFLPRVPLSDQDSAIDLAPGGFTTLYARVDSTGGGDAIDQSLELLLGTAGSGWVFSFKAGSDQFLHGNICRNGRYGAGSFRAEAWRSGQWNELKIARCLDGKARFWVNGRELSQSLDGLGTGPLRLRLRGRLLNAKVAEKPF